MISSNTLDNLHLDINCVLNELKECEVNGTADKIDVKVPINLYKCVVEILEKCKKNGIKPKSKIKWTALV